VLGSTLEGFAPIAEMPEVFEAAAARGAETDEV
jgi:hypothetical protein